MRKIRKFLMRQKLVRVADRGESLQVAVTPAGLVSKLCC